MAQLIKMLLLAFLFTLPFEVAMAQSCARQKTCSQMKSCKEATYYFKVCGHSRRDGDNDGIPCEKLCGKTMSQYKKRLAAGR
ncbi:excalibur calcium-binding domain-containing protein [uncultured Cohaesibacter sp.]|uniref:excalibur calcium-binding domain-containing protein n=1 Tax=uncultured Cohaesibacter sp. TaxID=1002546 RepID=UPI002930C426|nr:excalibur calcium-binding domain-containing protein [uncultured Cohaesibacter sp.]